MEITEQETADLQKEPEPNPEYKFELQLDNKITQAQSLFVAPYGPSSVFVESCLKQGTHIGHLNFIRERQVPFANIYYDKQNLYIIFTEPFKPAVYEYHFADFIKQSFTVDRIVIIDYKYQSNLDDKTRNLRYLKSSCWTDKCVGVPFKGSLTGPTADLLAKGEMLKQKVICYVGVIDDYEITKDSLGVYSALENYQLVSHQEVAGGLIRKFNTNIYSHRLYL